jgi:hypothetical protein
MPFLRLVDVREAVGLLEEEYDAAVARAGKVFNILEAMSLRPGVLRESMGLYREMSPHIRRAAAHAVQEMDNGYLLARSNPGGR